MTTLSLPDWPWQLVRRLAAERGVQVWPVGGAVRDLLLEQPVRDWDFAVDRQAMDLARSVADALGAAFYPLDVERGTARVILAGEEGTRLDFATLRGPDLQTDLAARDFTINAMALDDTATLVDPTGGGADLEAGVIRATSEVAFRDDPVRLLRAVRIEAQQGFAIEPQTAAWMRRDAALLTVPSVERVRDEIVLGMALSSASSYLQRLDEFRLLPHVVPELDPLKGVIQSPPHCSDAWRHTLATVEAVGKVIATFREPSAPSFGQAQGAGVPRAAWGDLARVLGQFAAEVRVRLAIEVSDSRDRALLLKLAALLHDVGKPKTRSEDEDGRIHFHNHEQVGAQMAAARLRKLRFSRDEVKQVGAMIEGHLRPAHLSCVEEVTRRAIHRYFRDTGETGVELILLSLADYLAAWGPSLQEEPWARRLSVAETLMSHYFERRDETIAPPPLVTGWDLMSALRLGPGAEIGRLLRALTEAQAAGEVETREQALALAARISGTASEEPVQS